MTQLRVGIVGGGQLGRLLAISAKKMGMIVTVTDPTPNSPAGQVANHQIIGGYKDEKATRELAKLSDVITVDAEFVNDEVLEELEKTGKSIHPSPKTIRIIKDKLQQKQFLKSHNIPTAEFVEVATIDDIKQAAKKFGYPLLLKARTDAYDGKGNFVVKSRDEIEKGLEKLKGRKLYVEQFVPFVKELAIMVARNTKGEIATYPVVETIHVNNICDTVIAPARVSQKAKKAAESLGKKVVEKLKGAGVFGIEMFLKKDDNVLVNEIAPRVHNSGHYTIEAVETSQFEQHICAIAGMPLGNTEMTVPFAVMKNILGQRHGSGVAQGVESALKIPGVSVHMYGKHESRPERKMGHITVVGDSVEECLRKANETRKLIVI